jgi:hypothetical protein
VTAIAALALATIVSAIATADAGGDMSVLVVATGATLLLVLALAAGRVAPILLALALLGAIYVVPDGDRATPAPIFAGSLLLIAELAFWSLDERTPGHLEPGTSTPRLLGILAVVVAATAASTLVMLAAEIDMARSPAGTAAGVGAILACVALLAALARSHTAPY